MRQIDEEISGIDDYEFSGGTGAQIKRTGSRRQFQPVFMIEMPQRRHALHTLPLPGWFRWRKRLEFLLREGYQLRGKEGIELLRSTGVS